MPRMRFALVVVAIVLLLVLGVYPAVAQAGPQLPNGFTAKVVAYTGQVITGNINATGYDVGIYIGPGIHDVKVNGATVSGANDEGILVQRAYNVVVEYSHIYGNAVDPYSGLTEVKGLVLAGSTNCEVLYNLIEDNQHGGVSVLDDGSSVVFAPTPIDSTPAAGNGNVLIGNDVKDNVGDCAIVLSAKNPGGGVSHNLVFGNTLTGGVNGLVVAGGAFGPVVLQGNNIQANEITGGFIPGISIHAFGPGVITDTLLINNRLSNNGAGEQSKDTTGIEIFAVPNVGTISGTRIVSDQISGDHFGVWHVGDTGTSVARLTGGSAIPIFP
jgi:hypothetical protein